MIPTFQKHKKFIPKYFGRYESMPLGTGGLDTKRNEPNKKLPDTKISDIPEVFRLKKRFGVEKISQKISKTITQKISQKISSENMRIKKFNYLWQKRALYFQIYPFIFRI